VVWLNPFRPEVQQLITDLVLEVVRQYDAEGIQFDDHMSLPRDFGYDSFTTALYRKQTGRKPPANPDDPAWVKWRADRITSFMAQLARAVRKAARCPDLDFPQLLRLCLQAAAAGLAKLGAAGHR
jgi:uncharacterized lipoprotein YddW (UPF0748 family)